jgi:superfamily II DNA or RNA helicase
MSSRFKGWQVVAEKLRAVSRTETAWLDAGQRASLSAISELIIKNGLIIADEVGMGKTRIAVEVCRAVTEAHGRVAVLVPTGLGFQWQDEFSKGGMESPQVVRSLWGFLKAWEDKENLKPWYKENIVILTHTFSNWRMSENSADWRWGMLPAIYAYWKKKNGHNFPRGYRGISDPWVHNAALDICEHIHVRSNDAYSRAISSIENDYDWHLNPNGSDYVKHGKYRTLLHNAVGLGLGKYDLVIIDEAHKSRGDESGLSRLLREVLLKPSHARRMALTATPVELGVEQWMHTLSRIGVKKLEDCRGAVDEYANAVNRVRKTWASSDSSREYYFEKSKKFQTALSPYLIRRDKRMDESVLRFTQVTGESYDAYRVEKEILILSKKLPMSWKQAICAAESLSFVTRQQGDLSVKRLRLTMGNGHGITAYLDQVTRTEEDARQEEGDKILDNDLHSMSEPSDVSIKQKQRIAWWKQALHNVLSGTNDLYDHPAILATVKEIESYTQKDQKVLVFGRFTAPLRALTELLNARHILMCFREKISLPQEKIHEGERRAMTSALNQLKIPNDIAEIDAYLKDQYRGIEKRRDKLRNTLIIDLRAMLSSDIFEYKLVNEIEKSKNTGSVGYSRLVRAIDELLDGYVEPTPKSCCEAFLELIKALNDRDDDPDDEYGSEIIAGQLWIIMEQKLNNEYSSQSGTFTRLLYGETRHETRRLLQIGFNRTTSFPKVLVAQSMVGREGLNLHEACRVVILLHPEWNPGVVEQQIGRIDRVNSRWSKEFVEYYEDGCNSGEIPRIEIRPVIFEGTYDEYNWKVLRERWDDLRAQLHGIVVPQRFRKDLSGEYLHIVNQLDEKGPNFTPVIKKHLKD